MLDTEYKSGPGLPALMNHAAKGVTDKDFELARKIEEVVMWQPGVDDGSALEGTMNASRP
ncbi:MAG: 4a-hydroxytetrahydrobiopterin dehydratase [Gammaproteobacteria bacterium]|jgi:4a-hydroxytetrahydrobiopterin dehydratase